MVGKAFGDDMYGKVHVEWRKKAIKSFKPDIVDQYTPFIQQSANDIVLSGIAEQSQKSGKHISLCEWAKKFAFEIGVKFVMGPLLNTNERNEAFPVCSMHMCFNSFFQITVR